MRKLNELLFPQKWKENAIVRLYVVLIYFLLIFWIFFSFVYNIKYTFNQALILTVRDVERELGYVLLDQSITSETAWVLKTTRIYTEHRENNIDGVKFYNEVKYQDLPNLAYKQENKNASENIELLRELLIERIESYRDSRAEVFSLKSALIEGLIYIFVLIIPLFIFFRAVFYHIVLYIIFGNNKLNNKNN